MAVSRHNVGPRACIEPRPTHKSLKFGGRYISLTLIGAVGGFHYSYLSRIFNGKANPSAKYLRRVSETLGMTVDEFYQCLDERVADLKAGRAERLSELGETA